MGRGRASGKDALRCGGGRVLRPMLRSEGSLLASALRGLWHGLQRLGWREEAASMVHLWVVYCTGRRCMPMCGRLLWWRVQR